MLNEGRNSLNIINSIKLLFFPKAFARAEIKESERRVTDDNANFGEMEERYEETLKRVSKKRKGIFRSLLFVTSAVIPAFLLAQYANSSFNITTDYLRYVRLLAVIVVGWAVLGRIGYETQTMDGNTLLEKTSESTFKIFYLLGIFLTTVALFLEPTSFNNIIQPTPDGAA